MTHTRRPICYPSQDLPKFTTRMYIYDPSFFDLPRETLIDLFDNDNVADLITLIYGKEASDNFYNYNNGASYLIDYCIHNSDIEFMELIVAKKSINIFEQAIALKIMASNNSDIHNIFFGGNYKIRIQNFFHVAIYNNNSNALNLLYNYGYQLDDLSECVFSGHVEIIQYFQSMGNDIQCVFDACDFTEFNYDVNINIFKTLIESHIDITSKINNILYLGVECENIDLVKFCIDHGANDFDLSLNTSCMYNWCDILELLIQSGADVQYITEDSLPRIKYEMVIILLKYGYNFPLDSLKIIFYKQFNEESDINKVTYLFNLVGNFDYVFEKEQFTTYNADFRDYTKSGNLIAILHSASILEYIVSKNKLDHLKLIVENSLDKLKSELNRLFIIAVSNGHVDMALYLLDLGVDVTFATNLALDCAVFFGHYPMIKLLLDLGIVLGNSVNNLFMMCAYGSSVREYQEVGYVKLINNSVDVFRNDYYNFGVDYLDIFKFLIQNNIQIPNYTFYEVLYIRYYDVDIFNYYMPSDVNIKLNSISKTNKYCYRYLLKRAIYCGAISVVKLLLENGANVLVNENMKRSHPSPNKLEIIQLLEQYNVLKKIEI